MKKLLIILLFGFSLNLKAQTIGSIYQLKPIDEKNPFSKFEKQDYYLYVHELKNGYVLFEILPHKNSEITLINMVPFLCQKII